MTCCSRCRTGRPAADYPVAERAFEDLVAHGLTAAIPPADLAIQWDLAFETQNLEGVLAWARGRVGTLRRTGHPADPGHSVALCTPARCSLPAFGAGDLEMRDLLICSLTEGSRLHGKTVAAAFGIQPSQVSRIRSRYREHCASLVHQMGRPPILSAARLRQARLRAGQGLTHAEIGLRLGVSRSRISELIKQHGTLPAPPACDGAAATHTFTLARPLMHLWTPSGFQPASLSYLGPRATAAPS